MPLFSEHGFVVGEPAEHVVRLAMGSTRTGADLGPFHRWCNEVRAIVKFAHSRTGKKVRVLVDGSGITSYDPATLKELAGLIGETEPHIERIAVFGLTSSLRAVEEVIIALSGMDRIKNFDTEESAEAWTVAP